MARPAWTNIPDADVAINAPLEAVDVGAALRNNATSLRIAPFAAYYAENSTTSLSPTFAELASVYVLVPSFADYTGIQRVLSAHIECKVANAAATGTYRIEVTEYSLTGGSETTTSTSYVYKTPTINLSAATSGQIIRARIKAHTSNASYAAFSRCIVSMGWYLEF